jgi:argininosuccinate lyase
MGSAAFAGTGWPIDRYRTMELLGFDDLIENSQDGVASVDYFMEFSAALAIHMTNLSRLAFDIQVWSTDEYMMIDLDEAYAGTSSIMPQKKNPVILEQVKSYASECIGAMVAVVSAMRGVSYSNIVDRVMLEPVVIDTVVGSTKVMSGIVNTMRPIKENMMDRLREGFSTMTDLADTLVKLHNLSFRQAHDIIVDVTLNALQKKVRAVDISVEMIEEASKKALGRTLKISEQELRSAVDPVINVNRRNVIGGPAPESVYKMIENQREKLKEEERRRKIRLKRIAKANEKLVQAEHALGCLVENH